MTDYLRLLPKSPTYRQKGLSGYRYPLNLTSAEVYQVDSTQGHDGFVTSASITHIYYILEGAGTFEIDEQKLEVTCGDLVEVPPSSVFTFSGKMKLLLIMSPPFAEGEVVVVQNR